MLTSVLTSGILLGRLIFDKGSKWVRKVLWFGRLQAFAGLVTFGEQVRQSDDWENFFLRLRLCCKHSLRTGKSQRFPVCFLGYNDTHG